jgi:hypothetical protein
VYQALSHYAATMRGTKIERDARRARRWLGYSGGFTYITPEAFDLLVQRLDVRRRLAWIFAPPLLLVATALLWPVVSSSSANHSQLWQTGEFAAVVVVIVAAVLGLRLLSDQLAARVDRDIAARFAHRVTRAERVPVRVTLGRVRGVFVLAAMTLHAAMGIALIVAGEGWLALTYLAGLSAICVLVLLGLRHSANRPTIAIDAPSLALDERLRAEDAFASTAPLMVFVWAFPLQALGPRLGWLATMWFVCLTLINALWLWAQNSKPWPRTPGEPVIAPITAAGPVR